MFLRREPGPPTLPAVLAVAPFSRPVLSSWRALARGVRQVATVVGLTALFAAVDASAGAPAAAAPAAVTAAPSATMAATARPAAKTRRKAAASKRAKARTAKAASRAARRRSTRRAGHAEADAAPAPTLELPTVDLPDLAVAPSAGSTWEAALTGAAAPTAAADQPTGPLAALSRSATSLLDGLVARARGQLGTRYVYGAAAPGAELDCSSFVRYVMEALDVRLPRTANQQARVGRAVPRDESQLRPGDLLTFGRGRHTSHVGIYLGEGRFIHASVKSGQVIETTIERNRSLFRRWQGARRLLAGADTLAGDASSGG